MMRVVLFAPMIALVLAAPASAHQGQNIRCRPTSYGGGGTALYECSFVILKTGVSSAPLTDGCRGPRFFEARFKRKGLRDYQRFAVRRKFKLRDGALRVKGQARGDFIKARNLSPFAIKFSYTMRCSIS